MKKKGNVWIFCSFLEESLSRVFGTFSKANIYKKRPHAAPDCATQGLGFWVFQGIVQDVKCSLFWVDRGYLSFARTFNLFPLAELNPFLNFFV